MDLYVRKVLRVSVAQICQTIGYNSIQSIPLELLIDSLHKFLQEFARDLHRHVELFNRTEANLDDVGLSLQSLNISVSDLFEYINHVQPVACNIEIPRIPAPKTSNLNFLKPGSKEVLSRPVHIYEHLPPMVRPNGEIDDKSLIVTADSSPNPSIISASNDVKSPNEISEDSISKLIGPIDTNDLSNTGFIAIENSLSNQSFEGKPKSSSDPDATPPSSSACREISSVMMTSGGFISPAIEGRTAECFIPDVVEKYFGLDSPPTQTTNTVVSSIPVSTVKTTTASSQTLNSPSTSLTSSIKTEDSTAPPTGVKVAQTLDKKLLKKVKKKSMIPMVPPNIPGAATVTVNDKAQRKRIKMLQKSMTKNTVNAVNGNFKNKNGSGVAQGSQDKYLKKQYKLKQKQNRHQYVQKLMEAALSATPNAAEGSSRGQAGQTSTQISEAGASNKTKKDYFAVPAPLEEELPPSESEVCNPLLVPVPSPHFKEAYNQPLSGSQDTKMILPLAQTAQSMRHGSPPPLYDEIKLSNEPDRNKLNIFKKISSSRKERADVTAPIHPAPAVKIPPNTDVAPASSSSGTTIFGDDQVISLPSGTTITPAPPSGSGRHVYAPPPPTQSGDFDAVVQVDDDGSIPEGSAVLMQRGDLMIHKPKKRGRKPGSKNQPKLLGLTAKKAKKLKKTFFGHHPASNLLEPLNLSHSSIENIANIPLGIASTFPIDPEAALKLKKDRKKAKLAKDTTFIRNTGKSPSTRNLAPTKEEFASINQKLMMMDTVLQAAPPLLQSTSSSSKTARSNSPLLETATSFPIEREPTTKQRKERKKAKQPRDHKQIPQQGTQSLSSNISSKSSTNGSTSRKSPSFSNVNFPNYPFYNLPLPFLPLTPRPGLIPSHNIFSGMPNMKNNPMFMPSLMGFRPLNPPIRSFLKDEKESTPPLLPAGEGNYSKVAPLVPDTMKLELSQTDRTTTTSPGACSSKLKSSSISSTASTKTGRSSPAALTVTPEPVAALYGSHFGESRRKGDEINSSTVVSSSSGNNLTVLKNIDVTIEVSSDDSVHGEMGNKPSPMTSRTAMTSTAVSSTSGFHRQTHPSNDFSIDGVNIVEDSDTSHAERRVKEHKKLKKLNKQGKKQPVLSVSIESKCLNRMEPGGAIGAGFDDELPELISSIPEYGKKGEEFANLPSNLDFKYEISPERRKDHKKMKKLLKEGKLKKKKDKKDKNKSKDRSEKVVKGDKSEKRKEEKKDKDKLKKIKKEKKKEKQRTDIDIAAIKYSSSGEGNGSSTEVPSVVPKLTLKLGQSCQSPTSQEGTDSRKSGIKTSLVSAGGIGGSKATVTCTSTGREPSPELARISPLVTRPPKQKSALEDVVSSSSMGSVTSMTGCSGSAATQPSTSHQTPTLSASLNILVESVIDIDSNSCGPITSLLPASATILGVGMSTASNSPVSTPIVASTTSSTTALATVHSGNNQHQPPHQHVSSNKLSEANRPSSYIDAEGNRVWICPACGKVDDGSAMIGCDGCDAWYHWVCVGILVAPNDNEDWYCRVCITKKRGVHGDRKRKRNKKKNINS